MWQGQRRYIEVCSILILLVSNGLCVPMHVQAASTEEADFWHEAFTPVDAGPGAQAFGWLDETDNSAFNAELNYSTTAGQGELVRTSDDVWGKTLSPVLICPVSTYPKLEINVSQVSSAATWKVGIQECGSANYWDLCTAQTQPGLLTVDYAQVTGWSSEKKYYVQITVDGGAGEKISVDYVRVFGNRRNAAANTFVQVNSLEPDQLSVNGTIIKIKGTNYYPAYHSWPTYPIDFRTWHHWNPEQVETELARSSQLGFNSIRAFIHYNEFGWQNVKPEMLARMENFLYLAEKHHLRVEFAFFPMEQDYGTDHWEEMKAHLTQILSRFINDERIFGWGITNEVDLITYGFWTPEQVTQAYAWHHAMAVHMQTVDNRHLVIAGSARAHTVKDMDLSAVDVFCLHYGGLEEFLIGAILKAKEYMQTKNCVRPILIEEFGTTINSEAVAEYISAFFNRTWNEIYQTDVCGGMIWCLNDITNTPGEKHEWGLFKTTGEMKVGVNAILTAYQGTNFDLIQPLIRPATPVPIVPDVTGQERILISAQQPDVVSQWHPDKCQFSKEAETCNLFAVTAPVNKPGNITNSTPLTLNMDQETDLRITIREVKGRWAMYLRHPGTGLLARLQSDTPMTGSFVYNLKNYLTDGIKTGMQTFIVEIQLVKTEQYESTSLLRIESFSVVSGQRLSPPLVPEGTTWMDHFSGTLWVQPEGWMDESEDSEFNAHLAYSAHCSYAYLTRTGEGTWGKALSPELKVNVDAYPLIAIKVRRCAPNAYWKLGIQEVGHAWQYWDVSGNSTSEGTYVFNYQEITQLHGLSTFKVQLVLEDCGSGGEKYVEVDYIQLLDGSAAYNEEFNQAIGQVPAGWESGLNHATITGTGNNQGQLNLLAGQPFGNVLSTVLREIDTDLYSELEVNITELSGAGTYLDIGLQEVSGSYRYFPVFSQLNTPGIYRVSIADAARQTDSHRFALSLWINGTPQSSSALIEFIRIGKAVSATPTPTPTMTATPTADPKKTFQLEPRQVLTYPNPGRNQITFAYRGEGEIQVTLDLYTLNGERVAHIVENKTGKQGEVLTTTWEAAGVAPGIYLGRVVVSDKMGTVFSKTKKVALIR